MLPIQRHIKNVVNNYTEAEIKVREATSNDSWGPTSTLMNEIAHMTYNMISVTEITRMIWRRLNDRSKNWRHVYKSLILLEYLVKNGSYEVSERAKSSIHTIQILEQFHYVEDGKDYGKAIRDKARSLVELLKNEELIRSERQKALSTTNRLDLGGFGQNDYPPSKSSNRFTKQQSSPSHSYSGRVNEYETAMPQSAIEEDLQIKLALAMSKEEHEREEQKRQKEQISEEAKLQLAMERSRQDSSTNGQPSKDGALFNLVDTSLSAAPADIPDPWNINSPNSRTNQMPKSSIDDSPLDIFNAQSTSKSNPFPLQNHNISTPSLLNNDNQLINFNPKPMVNDPWVGLASPASPVNALTNSSFQSSLEKNVILKPLNVTDNAKDIWGLESAFASGASLSSQQPSTSQALVPVTQPCEESSSLKSEDKHTKKDPAAFLGEHIALVNLDKLVERSPQSTNPFSPAPKPPMNTANPFMGSNSTAFIPTPINSYTSSTINSSFGYMQPSSPTMALLPTASLQTQHLPAITNMAVHVQYPALMNQPAYNNNPVAPSNNLNPFL